VEGDGRGKGGKWDGDDWLAGEDWLAGVYSLFVITKDSILVYNNNMVVFLFFF
jgi:hypothetical protein